ncbi:MAG: pyruvate carboxylase [Bdellovibrionales bacterium]|nr:pyruvate carboxylase [Bdellovibrionales bacterium]
MVDSPQFLARPFRKVLVCNRGEIAIRVFRSCTELGVRTVAVYSYEDRFSLHRYKADEAYQIGQQGKPVQSYLSVDEVIAIARRAGAEAIHPGYGFLSERAELCRAVEAAGLAFIGPTAETLEIAGDKVKTRALADAVGVPVLPGSGMLHRIEDAAQFAGEHGYPLMIKAAHGGGGRGMRLVTSEKDLPGAWEAAGAEAKAAFGSAEVFAEKYVPRPKHIEVQLLGDGSAEVVHLFERDCSLQRRHQKVIEVAPAVSLPQSLRDQLYEYALKLGRALKLRSAATAEFLVAEDGAVYFIEINPRIQVEHTVTEEVTGIDLVQCQVQIAAGRSLPVLEVTQASLRLSGVAIQCRITTENPQKNFTPDYGKLLAYRSASGFGIRLDAGSAFTGAVITPFYDSMLVKVTSHGRSMRDAASRMRRALSEFRVRGVSTNIAFLENLLRQETFLAGDARTTYLQEHPEVFELPKRRDRANRLLRFLSDVTVNGHESMPGLRRPRELRTPRVRHYQIAERSFSAPCYSDSGSVPPGWRDELNRLGRDAFLRRVRDEKRLLITDTTFRDAHQSLFATRMRSFDMLAVARPLAIQAPELFSLEMWGGATFDVMLRFLREDPWERLVRLREAVPNILFQMLIRGANGVGYKSYPDNVIDRFIKEAHRGGMDIFRIFDSLNNPERMKAAIESVREAGAIAEVCVCYTGDVAAEEARARSGQATKYSLAYYRDLTCTLAEMGADIIAIKDMAGLLRPYAAELLVKELRAAVQLPIHFHTHDTAGVQSAAYLKAAEAGVDIVDCAFASMSGVTSQPCSEGLVGALAGTERDTGLDLEALTGFSGYWETVRTAYEPFESDLRAPTGEVYLNEIPGGQYSNFRPQAASLGLGDRWSELKDAYRAVNRLFGDIIKVTPSSKVVGDMALFMVANSLSIEELEQRAGELDFPSSVVEFFQGEIGIPQGGFPEPLRTNILRGKPRLEATVSERLAPADFDEAQKAASEALGAEAGIRDALSYLLYPHVFKQYGAARRKFGDVGALPTAAFFYGLEEGEEIEVEIEAGKRLIISLVAVSEPGEKGERTVFFELNGQPRSMQIADRKIAPTEVGHPKATPGNPKQVGAPLAGVLVALAVRSGSEVRKDDPLCTLEAMKMQTAVQAPLSGKVKRVALEVGARIEVGDLLLEFE